MRRIKIEVYIFGNGVGQQAQPRTTITFLAIDPSE